MTRTINSDSETCSETDQKRQPVSDTGEIDILGSDSQESSKSSKKRLKRKSVSSVTVAPAVEQEQFDKPIEEAPIEEIFPEFDVNKTIKLVRHYKEDVMEGSLLLQGLPVQKFLPQIPFKSLKPVPTPSFRQLNQVDLKQPIEPELIKFQQPSEDFLNEIVEYDMDAQDKYWLELINSKRPDQVSEDFFELVMDRLEKEWFDLTKEVMKTKKEDFFDFPEDINCAVCDDGECENSNAIVFCDGCNLAVHQDCYGVPFIPEGQWLCRKCMLSPDKTVSCILCPNKGGAFKQTTTSKWVHSLCALWIPEVSVANHVYMEPIENIEMIPKQRWKLNCYICKNKKGACIQCDVKSCFTSYHVTCARAAHLYMNIKPTCNEVVLKSFCDKHTPKEYLTEVDVVYNVDYLQQFFAAGHKLRDRKRKQNQQPATIIPKLVFSKVLESTKCTDTDFLKIACQYWSLKRDARRGAPLLKRLHLEPWTASTSALKEDEQQKAQKYKNLQVLRKDLERLRTIVDLVKKREKEKLKRINLIAEILAKSLYPIGSKLLECLKEIEKMDSRRVFSLPVDVALVVDYYDFIKNPMDFSTIRSKIEQYEYSCFDEFYSDVQLVFDNCCLYNKPDTYYHKLALKLQTGTADVLYNTRQWCEQHQNERSSLVGDLEHLLEIRETTTLEQPAIATPEQRVLRSRQNSPTNKRTHSPEQEKTKRRRL